MRTNFLVVGAVALVIGLVLGWMVRGVATYNVHAAQVSSYEDWRVACPAAEAKDAACELSTDIIDKSQPNGNAIARATITTDRDGKQVVGFTLPYGVALQAGMGLQFGSDPVKVYPYRTCNTVGCIAVAPFDNSVSSALKSDKDTYVMFAGLDGKPVKMPMSLKGYDRSYAAWKSAEARRHSWFWRLWS